MFVFSLQDRDNGGIEPFLASMGLYSTLIQPLGYLSITKTFLIVEMFNQNINNLLTFGVFFVIYKIVGLKFNRKFKERDSGGKKGSIRKLSITVE